MDRDLAREKGKLLVFDEEDDYRSRKTLLDISDEGTIFLEHDGTFYVRDWNDNKVTKPLIIGNSLENNWGGSGYIFRV